MHEICNRHGVLMIADEVMCGSGRCGTWRALEFDGVTADIMTVAKGLSGGFIPLGATVYSSRRITSYNVCYTKLLRGVCGHPELRDRPAEYLHRRIQWRAVINQAVVVHRLLVRRNAAPPHRLAAALQSAGRFSYNFV